METFTALSLFITGMIAGTFGGFLGLGGGFIMLPALSFIYGYHLPIAIGTTITAIIFTAISGTFRHLRMKNVDFETTKLISTSGAIGAIVGSLAFFHIYNDFQLLNFFLSIVFLYTSLRMIHEALRREAVEIALEKILGSKKAKMSLGFSVGFLVGILGLGGGFALVPSFVYFFGSGIKIAVGTSLASFLSMAVVSSIFKIYQGVVDFSGVLFLGVGTMIGAQIGAKLTGVAPAWIVKLLFGLFFLYTATRFALEGLSSALIFSF